MHSTTTDGHILAGRVLVFGTACLTQDELKIVEYHALACASCKEKIKILASLGTRFVSAMHESMHPTVEDLMAYATPEMVPEFIKLSDAQRADIQEHLNICVLCREITSTSGVLSKILGP